MAIPKAITSAHVSAAIAKVVREGIPAGAESTKFDLVDPITGANFPPKLVLSLAAEIATGRPLPRTDFSGGAQTNEPLEALGFKIIPKGPVDAPMLTLDDLEPGQLLTNQDLMDVFRVGNSGVMRWSSATGSLVLIANHSKSLYDDHWDGETLLYTGMGRTGDQELSGQNRRLAKHRQTNTPVHLFEVFTQNQYLYAGPVALAESVREGWQRDDNGVERRVFIFPLRLVSPTIEALPPSQTVEQLARRRQRSLQRKTTEELIALASQTGNARPGKRQSTVTQYQRSEAITVLVKRLADGDCELCRAPAPFETEDGPYLECHHLMRLADEGPDTLDNVVALCPNCHRRMHLVAAAADKQKLRARIARRNDSAVEPSKLR